MSKYDDLNRILRDAISPPKPGSVPPGKVPVQKPLSKGEGQLLPWEQRVEIDPNIRAAIDEAMPDLEAFAPEVAARVRSGEPGAMLEAYRYIADRDGVIRPAGQMELPFGEEPTGLVPFGVRGPGVPVFPPESRALIPYAGERGLIVPPRAMSVRDIPVINARGGGPPRRPPVGIGGAGDDAADWIRRNRVPLTAAGAGLAAGVTSALMQNEAQSPEVRGETAPPRRPLVPDITRRPRPLSTADLAAETAPPPAVTTLEDAPITLDYAEMARDKIRQANEIQLREGRITPESAALARQADALYLKAAEARRAGNHPPIMPVDQQNDQTSAIKAQARRELRDNVGADPRSQARRILSMLNAGQIPPAQRAQAKAEMTRLYAIADQQDNARRR